MHSKRIAILCSKSVTMNINFNYFFGNLNKKKKEIKKINDNKLDNHRDKSRRGHNLVGINLASVILLAHLRQECFSLAENLSIIKRRDNKYLHRISQLLSSSSFSFIHFISFSIFKVFCRWFSKCSISMRTKNYDIDLIRHQFCLNWNELQRNAVIVPCGNEKRKLR